MPTGSTWYRAWRRGDDAPAPGSYNRIHIRQGSGIGGSEDPNFPAEVVTQCVDTLGRAGGVLGIPPALLIRRSLVGPGGACKTGPASSCRVP